MVQEKVTRQELRELRVRQTRIFILKEPKQVASARMTAHMLAREEGFKFCVRPDYHAVAIAITREK